MQGFKPNSAISMTEGRVFVNGEERTNTVSCTANFTINTAEVPVLGARTIGDKALTYKITGTLTEYKATKWLIEYCKKFQEEGTIELFDIQGVTDDKNSDYSKKYGTDRITLKDCVLTGDIPLFNIDATGEVVTDEISFTANRIL